jgi:hypothetical protein
MVWHWPVNCLDHAHYIAWHVADPEVAKLATKMVLNLRTNVRNFFFVLQN